MLKIAFMGAGSTISSTSYLQRRGSRYENNEKLNPENALHFQGRGSRRLKIGIKNPR